MARHRHCLEPLIPAATLCLGLTLVRAYAAGDLFPSPATPSEANPPPPAASTTSPSEPVAAPAQKSPSAKKPPSSVPGSLPTGKGNSGKASQKKQRSELEYQKFLSGYQQARALVLAGNYPAAIAAFHALGHDDSPEVANYIGYSYRKLGDYDLAKVWYDKALLADPNHVRTWQYYGLWHLEQGNKLKAQDFLEKIRLVCGDTSCPEYQDLQAAIEHDALGY